MSRNSGQVLTAVSVLALEVAAVSAMLKDEWLPAVALTQVATLLILFAIWIDR